MNILWFKPILPYPPDQGTRRVSLQVLTTLARNHRIRLVSRLLGSEEVASVDALRRAVPGLEVIADVVPNRRSFANRVGTFAWSRARSLGGVPPVESITALPGLVRRFAEEASVWKPDLVVAEYWYSKPFLDAVSGVPRVLFAHDVEYAVRRGAGTAQRDGGRGSWWGRGEEARERAALTGADRVWFLTEGDRDRVARDLGVPAERTAVLPYGLDLDGELAARGDDDPPEHPSTVLFFGSFAADFNRDALRFTLDHIWPALVRLRPDARLRIAGGGLPEDLAARARAAGAMVDGRVDDVRSTLLGAAAVLVPLRFGGGLRIRLLESLALERAVVGTGVGVLGMGPQAETHVLVGETADELAGQLARALEEPALRRSLGRNGRDWVARHHGVAAAALRQEQLVDEARRPVSEPRPGNP